MLDENVIESQKVASAIFIWKSTGNVYTILIVTTYYCTCIFISTIFKL